MVAVFLLSLCSFTVSEKPVDSATLTVHKRWEFKSARYFKKGAYDMDKIKWLDLTDKSIIHIEIEGESKPQTSKYKVVDNFILILDEKGNRITDADFDIRIESLTDKELTLVIVAHFVAKGTAIEGDLVEMIFTEHKK